MDRQSSSPPPQARPDLSNLPPIFTLPTHLDTDSLVRFEDALSLRGAPLTYDASEARIFVGKVEQKRRAVFELRTLRVATEEMELDDALGSVVAQRGSAVVHGGNGAVLGKRKRTGTSPEKRVVIIGDDDSTASDTGSETQSDVEMASKQRSAEAKTPAVLSAIGSLHPVDSIITVPEDVVVVVKTSWMGESLTSGIIQPLSDYVVYTGRRIKRELHPAQQVARSTSNTSNASSQSILARARAELGPDRGQTSAAFASTSQHRSKHARTGRVSNLAAHIPALLHQTTSEHDAGIGGEGHLPPMPEWAVRGSTYSCERSTPADPPNAAFIAQLLIIRKARKLTGDEIGVRAYSTSVAAIAAYPHAIVSPAEILALPGCEGKIASLWVEWRRKNPDSSPGTPVAAAAASSSGSDDNAATASKRAGPLQGQTLIDAAREAEDDERLKVLRLFYEIWGVGDKTAREFHDRGWRDLDDVVEHGWGQLSRVQQIGVKYYDEFLEKIPRAEVEAIAERVHAATERVVMDPSGVRSCIVGGYRRGKKESGDVDVVVSHLDESATLNLIQEIVRELVAQGWITHELSTTLTGSRRGQATLPFRNLGGGHGFDTLDKALVVWQDPKWPGSGAGETAEERRRKNPNVHRRVDIIIAPWSKIGCAVLGWSAGTTFERDLRRYAKKVRNWKFDSSGIRDRNTGDEVDLESIGGMCTTCEEAERKVFKGLGLVYREPWERCTN